MNGYAIVLFVHLVCVLAATTASALAMLAALRLRSAEDGAEALQWVRLTETVIPAFPVAVVGLLATGGWMTHERWTWATPWIDAALVGLVLIVALGNGIEGTRGRALKRELEASGMSPRARQLVRDPLAWSAKMTTIWLVVGVMFVMTAKPAAPECAAVLVLAVFAGVLAAVPLWRAGVPGTREARPVRRPGGPFRAPIR